MTPQTRQLIGLGCLVAILVAVVWWQSGPRSATDPSPRTGRAAQAAALALAPPSTTADRPPAVADVPVVELALLGAARSEPVDSGRDPFRFGRSGRRADPGDASQGDLQAPAGRPAVRQAEIVPAEPPGPPPITLKFIGIVRRQGQGAPIAVLSDAHGVYHGREGDLIEGRYRIVRIGNDTIEMTYVDGSGRQLIRLSGL
jgi:hypothetical protein